MRRVPGHLKMLREYKYCEFYEAVYLYGGKNGSRGLECTDISPDTWRGQAEITFEKGWQKPFVLRRPEGEYGIGTDKFPKNEKIIVDFLRGHLERLQKLEKGAFGPFQTLFFPLPANVLTIFANLHAGNISYPETIRLFDFQELYHEVVFSNKFTIWHCKKMLLNPTHADEFFDHECKTRNLAVRVVAYFLFDLYPEFRWSLQKVASHPLMKLILKGASYIPSSCSHRILRDEIKKVVPAGLIKRGKPYPDKMPVKKQSKLPLTILDAGEINSLEIRTINFQALRIMVRAIILAKTFMRSPSSTPSLDEVLNYPLIKQYEFTLTPKAFEFVPAEVIGYVKFVNDCLIGRFFPAT